LFQLALVGGIGIEEELFIEAWAKYLDVDDETVRVGFHEAGKKSPRDIVGSIVNVNLKSHLVRDLLRVAALDGETDRAETEVFVEYIHHLDASFDWVLKCRESVLQDLQLLSIIKEGFIVTNDPDVMSNYLKTCIRSLRHEFVFFLNRSGDEHKDEVIAYIAFLERLSGVSLSQISEVTYLNEVVREFSSMQVSEDAYQILAWDFSLSNEELLQGIHSTALRSCLVRDVIHFIAVCDVPIVRKDTILRQMRQCWGMEAEGSLFA